MFIHDSLSELVVCGETEVLAGDLRMKMMSLERPAVSSGPTGYQKQFQVLLCSLTPNSIYSAKFGDTNL